MQKYGGMILIVVTRTTTVLYHDVEKFVSMKTM